MNTSRSEEVEEDYFAGKLRNTLRQHHSGEGDLNIPIEINGLRFSTIERDLTDASQFISSSSGNSLTQSQQLQCNLLVGNFEEMRAKLQLLIQHYVNNEEVLNRLLELNDRLDGTLQSIETVLVSSSSSNSPLGSYKEDSLESLDTKARSGNASSKIEILETDFRMTNLEDDIIPKPQELIDNTQETDIQQDSNIDEGKKELDVQEKQEEETNEKGEKSECNIREEREITGESEENENLGLRISQFLGLEDEQHADLHNNNDSSSAQEEPKKTIVPVERRKNTIDVCFICMEENQPGIELANCGCKLYCVVCLERLLRGKVFSGGVLDMRCPNCNSKIDESDIAALLDAPTYTKYQQFLFLASLRAEPNCRWCPNPACSSPVVRKEGIYSALLTCGSCSTQFCFDCSDYWHAGKTCEENKKEKKKSKSDIKSEKKKMRSGKPCIGCGAIVDKFGGCNHITCVYCKAEWCWICHTEFKPDHYFNTPCKGLQFTSYPSLRKAGMKSLKVGKYSLIAVGVTTGAIVALALVIPTVAIVLPVWGGYRVIKKIRK